MKNSNKKNKKLYLYNNYLCCPNCLSNLDFEDNLIHCQACNCNYGYIDKDIPSLINSYSQDTSLSQEKWEKIYKDNNYWNTVKNNYESNFLERTTNMISPHLSQKDKNNKIFFEVGSGSGYVGEYYAKMGFFYIGIDFSPESLIKLKKRLIKSNINNFILVHGDIQKMPIKNAVIDFSFGGGVIEHFRNTQLVVNHLYRITKKNGVAYNTVPYLNLGNMIFRSQWGGIPNIIVIKQLAELFHINLLKGRHMIFGYELQFTQKQLKVLHENAGFETSMIKVKPYYVELELNIIKSKLLKTIINLIAKKWNQLKPGLEVIAIK